MLPASSWGPVPRNDPCEAAWVERFGGPAPTSWQKGNGQSGHCHQWFTKITVIAVATQVPPRHPSVRLPCLPLAAHPVFAFGRPVLPCPACRPPSIAASACNSHARVHPPSPRRGPAPPQPLAWDPLASSPRSRRSRSPSPTRRRRTGGATWGRAASIQLCGC